MANNLRKLGISVALSVFMLLAIAFLALAYTDVGAIDAIWGEGLEQTVVDFSAVPQSVGEDAAALASELFDEGEAKYATFVDQLLTEYLEARDKDFLIVFNSGGWGWNMAEDTPGWLSILDGIKSELADMGYESVMLNYRRTSASLVGCAEELMETVNLYPYKARDLACQVEFLTANIPELRVIVAGESNGSVIADSTMHILKDNTSVYSIQTGSPFWHNQIASERTLLINNNGTVADTFSRGDIPAILWTSFRGLLGLDAPEENPGTVLKFLRAPGHDYSWQYPEVYEQVAGFLGENFGNNRQ